MNLTDLIIEIDDTLDRDFCQSVVGKFDQDERTYDGHSGATVNTRVKVSTDLLISQLPDWSDEDAKFFEVLAPHVTSYLDMLSKELNIQSSGFVVDSGYQIQRTSADGFYTWHSDDAYYTILDTEVDGSNSGTTMAAIERRLFTYIFYLNDFDEFEGGETEFFLGNGNIHTIKAKPGKLILFPANFLFQHRGVNVTSGSKYLATGWVSDFPAYGVKYSLGETSVKLRENLKAMTGDNFIRPLGGFS